MFFPPKLSVALAIAIASIPAAANTAVYAINGNQQFGVFDITSGSFNPIGPGMPEAGSGLVPGSNGNLLTLTISGNLDAINPSTGVVVSSLPTGLGNCTEPFPGQCGPNSANTLAEIGGVLYATDYQNRLYAIDPTKGTRTLIGQTGIPSVSPLVPFSTNSDGSLNFFGEALAGVNGTLYSTFFTGTLDPNTFEPTPVTQNHLYRIDPATGATLNLDPNNPITFGIDAMVNVNGTVYGFVNASGEIQTMNLANGATATVGGYDPATTGLIFGATPTPEPASMAFVGMGIALLAWRQRNKRRMRSSAPSWKQ